MKMNSDVSSYDDSYDDYENDSSVVDINVDEEDPEYDEDQHDLPTLESYKTDKEIRENERPKSRAGLWTFVCLVLLLIIITA